MADIKIEKEKALSLAEMQEELAKIKDRDKELGFRGKKTEEYLKKVQHLKIKDADALKSELQKLEILRLKRRHIIKITDILPKDLDSLRIIFASENVTIKQDDLTKILNIVKKYA